MRKVSAFVLLLAALAAVSCSPPGSKRPSASAAPEPTTKAANIGGEHKMGEAVQTQAGSRIIVIGWAKGAPKRADTPGPGQVYETIGVAFCAGPEVDVSGRELVHLFSLELPNGNRVAPDSATGKLELRNQGKVDPKTCTRGPIVFQVGGGIKPTFVVFESDPVTKWKVA